MSSVTATDEFREILMKTLRQAKEPLNALQVSKQLTGPAKKPREEVEAALEDFAQTGELYRIPAFRGQNRYWGKPLKDYIDLELLRALSDQPQTKSKVRGSLKAKLKDVKPAEINKHIDELVRLGRLKKWPTQIGARTQFFCARDVEADFYVDHALEKVIEKLKKEGLDQADVRRAALKIADSWKQPEPAPTTSISLLPVSAMHQSDAPTDTAAVIEDTEPNLEELILDRMSVVEPRADEGALVSLAELRNSLEFQQIPKRDFDEAVLRLRHAWRVSLAEHPHVASLSADEVEKLVHDGQGHYFNGIAFRERSES